MSSADSQRACLNSSHPCVCLATDGTLKTDGCCFQSKPSVIGFEHQLINTLPGQLEGKKKGGGGWNLTLSGTKCTRKMGRRCLIRPGELLTPLHTGWLHAFSSCRRLCAEGVWLLFCVLGHGRLTLKPPLLLQVLHCRRASVSSPCS